MLPHPESAIMILDLQRQERLRNAASQRLAIGAQRTTRSPRLRLMMIPPMTAVWLGVSRLLRTRVRQPASIAPPGIDPGTGARSTAY